MKKTSKVPNQGQDSLINVRVHKQGEESFSLYINEAHAMTIRFIDSDFLQEPSTKVVSLNKGRQRKGLYISKFTCPDEVISILTGDEKQDMQTLKHALQSFQRIYPTNNSNYSFILDFYIKMLKRIFTDPVVVPNIGKGPDLSHYFMDLPSEYFDDDSSNE